MTLDDVRDRAAEFLGRAFVLLERSAVRLQAFSGWRRFGAAFAAGFLSVAAQPPIHLLAVLLATLPCVVWLLDGTGEPSRQNWRAARAAAAIGWWFGFG